MPDKKISELTLGTPGDDDVIPFTDVGASVTYKALKSALKGADGTDGTDGDDAYVYIAYASDASGTDFTTTFDANLNYIAVKTTTTAIASPQASDFVGLWKNYKGATGTAGTDGTDGTDGVSYTWKGTYDAGTSYSANDCVAYNGTSYIYINATPGSGHTPTDDTYWDILALKGTDGAGGDVYGPATNTDSYIPQWDGANSKTLKDGLAVPAGGLAGLTALADKAPIASPTFTGTVTMPVALTGIAKLTDGVVSAVSDVDAYVTDATTSAKGKVELAIASEVDTGTSTSLAVTPDAFSGSVYGKRVVQIKVFDDATAVTTGDAKLVFCIPSELNGYNLVDADAFCSTASTSGTPTVQIRNVTDSQDMLSTRITIDQDEFTSYSAATAPVIDTTHDDVATGDRIAIDVDGAGTGTKGLGVILTFQLP